MHEEAGGQQRTMASFRYHSGYLADDEAAHNPYVARMPACRKPMLPRMEPVSRVGCRPAPRWTPGCSGQRAAAHRNPKGPQPFGSFLDFLTEGQVLESLQTVVEEATERVAGMKTGAGTPLVEVQDPVPSNGSGGGGRRARARPSLSTVRRHRVQPSLCVGRPNNYPSRSSSLSDSAAAAAAAAAGGWLGPHSQDSELGTRGLLPPVKDQLLLEKNLRRLLRLEKKGRCLSHSSPKDSLDSQTNHQWPPEQPLSWFSGLLGSSTGTPEASEQTLGEEELTLLQRELHKKIKSLLSQPPAAAAAAGAAELPGYCSLRQPHCALDFLAQHHLLAALQNVVSQAVDKLSGARRRDGCPLFAAKAAEPCSGLALGPTPPPPPPGDSQPASPSDKDYYYYCYPSPPTITSGPKVEQKRNKSRQGSPSTPGAPVATRFKLKVKPVEEPSPHPQQEGPTPIPELPRPPPTASLHPQYRAQPRRGLHLTLPAPGVVVEVASGLACLRGPVTPPLLSSCPSSSSPYLIAVPSSDTSEGRSLSQSSMALCPGLYSVRVERQNVGPRQHGQGLCTHPHHP